MDWALLVNFEADLFSEAFKPFATPELLEALSALSAVRVSWLFPAVLISWHG